MAANPTRDLLEEAKAAIAEDAAEGRADKARPSRLPRPTPKKVLLLVAAWGLLAFGGLSALLWYKFKPGPAAQAPRLWPAQSHLAHDGDRPTLMMVMHPKCSCSRASLGEFAKLMTRLQGKVKAELLLVQPPGVPRAWAETDVLDQAKSIPGAEVVIDENGVEAKTFGAMTSGQAYLYSSRGELLFEGGITPGRSHHGDNTGSQRIFDIVSGQGKALPSTAVYGCEIND